VHQLVVKKFSKSILVSSVGSFFSYIREGFDLTAGQGKHLLH